MEALDEGFDFIKKADAAEAGGDTAAAREVRRSSVLSNVCHYLLRRLPYPAPCPTRHLRHRLPTVTPTAATATTTACTTSTDARLSLPCFKPPSPFGSTHLPQMVLYAINLFLRVAESPDWPEDHRSFIMQQLPDLLSRAESLKGQTTQHTMPPMPPVGMPLAAHAILSTALPLAPGGACPQTQRPFPDQGQTPTSKGAFDAAAAAMYPPINHPPTSSASASSALHSPQAASCAACGTYLGKSLMSRLGVTAESTARRCARCHGSFCDSCFKNDSVQNDMCKGCEGETASFAS